MEAALPPLHVATNIGGTQVEAALPPLHVATNIGGTQVEAALPPLHVATNIKPLMLHPLHKFFGKEASN